MSRFFLLSFFLLWTGCTYYAKQSVSIKPYVMNDPFNNFNRHILQINNTLFQVTYPITKSYRATIPVFVRKMITNFFNNLSEPFIAILELIQLRPKAASDSIGRFMLNSSLGLGGLIDWGTPANHPFQTTTLGETLAIYGVPSGPYLIIPILGPSTVRDFAGDILIFIINPFSIKGFSQLTHTSITKKISLYGIYGLNTNTNVSEIYHTLQESSVDFYASLFNIYNQEKTKNIQQILSTKGYRIHHEDPLQTFTDSF